MAVDNFIPEVWSQKVLKVFDNTTVMANLVNRDYEGDIQNAGDTVKVRTFGDITINAYTRDMTIAYQALTDPMQTMTIDQQKYFAFKVDDLDQAQADIDILDGYTQRAAIAIRDVVDTHLLGHADDVDAGNVIDDAGDPITLTKDTIYGYIAQMGQVLDLANVGAENRALVITPEFKAMLLQSPEFTRATSLGDNIIQNGYIGNVAGGDTLTGLPSGYTTHAQLPFALRNDASGNFIPWVMKLGGAIQYDVAFNLTSMATNPTRVLNGGTATSYTDVDCSAFIPPISRVGIFDGHSYKSTASHYYLRPDGATHDGFGFSVGSQANYQHYVFDMPVPASRLIEYSTSTAGSLYVCVVGWYPTEVN